MEIKSEIPQSETDAVMGKPFEFAIQNNTFRVNPLTMRDYYNTERHMHRTLRTFYYLGIDLDKELKKQLDVNVVGQDSLEKARNIIEVIVRLMEPVKIKDVLKMIHAHNRKFLMKPRRWVASLKGWLHENLSLVQVVDLASYIMRYCIETKKKIWNLIQSKVTSDTLLETSKDQDSPDTTEKEWKPGFRSLGQDILGLP